MPDNELVGFQDRTGDVLQLITPKGYASQIVRFPMSTGAEQALKENPDNPVPVYETMAASNGASYRVVSLPTDIVGLAVQIGYPLTDVDNTLAFLRVALILVALGGVALAAGLGWAVGRASIRPVEDLTLGRRARHRDPGPFGDNQRGGQRRARPLGAQFQRHAGNSGVVHEQAGSARL